LNRETFMNLKVKLDKTGINVKRALAAEYSEEELLAAGYDRDSFRAVIDGESASFEPSGSTAKIYAPGSASYSYEISRANGTGKTYTLKYEAEDLYTGEITSFADLAVRVSGESASKGVLSLTGLRNGVYTLHIRVMEGNRVVTVYDDQFSIMADYTPQFMEDLSMRGVAAHWERETTSVDSQILAMKRAGIKYSRHEATWVNVEKRRGVYNFGGTNNYMARLDSAGKKSLVLGAYNNSQYLSPGTSTRSGVKTIANLDGYASYMTAVGKQYPYVKNFEIWNEPDMPGFWQRVDSDNYTVDYTNLVKYTGYTLRKELPGVSVMGGAIAQTWTTNLLSSMLANGAYGYIDTVSLHGYAQPSAVSRVFFDSRFATHLKLISDYGGWKRAVITECGAPTGTGANSVSENQQARDIVKNYVFSDIYGLDGCMIYVLTDPGIKDADTESRFGLTRDLFEAKPSYVAVRQLNQRLAGALYHGAVSLGENVVAGLYSKEGKPLLVLWYDNEQGSAAVSLGETGAVEDIMGNVRETASEIDVTREVNYVTGLNGSWFCRAARENLLSGIDGWTQRFGMLVTPDILTRISGLRTEADTLGGEMPPAEQTADRAEQFFEVGRLIIAGNNADCDNQRLSQMLFEWYKILKNYVNLYSVTETKDAAVPDYEAAAQSIETAKKTADVSSLPYSEAILKYAGDYRDGARQIRGLENNPAKQGIISSYSLMCGGLLDWAQCMSAVEAGVNSEIIMKVTGKYLTVYEGISANIPIDVINLGERVFDGTLSLYTPDGKLNNSLSGVKLRKSGVTSKTIALKDSVTSPDGKYVLRYESGGRVIAEQNLIMNLQKTISLSLMPAESALGELGRVRIKVTNSSNMALSGSVEVTPPDGWKLAQTGFKYDLAANSGKVYDVAVTAKTPAPYHFYTFGIAAFLSDGGMCAEVSAPLSFLSIVKADAPIDITAFDGGISGFENAYPIYINPVANPKEVESWKNANVSGRVLTKWDKDNIYLMCDVYDNYFAQQYTGAYIWNGDNVQLLFDTLNDKATTYQADDVEIGYALSSDGYEGYCWHSATGSDAGPRSTDNVKIIRSNDERLTRYLIKVPKEELNYSEITLDRELGLNVAFNDSDLGDRETYVEFSEGLAGRKNPSLLYTFRLTDNQKMSFQAGAKLPFVTELNGN
jgi:hypothetical protein